MLGLGKKTSPVRNEYMRRKPKLYSRKSMNNEPTTFFAISTAAFEVSTFGPSVQKP